MEPPKVKEEEPLDSTGLADKVL